MRTASEAAANLLSGHGGFLSAPTAMARLVTPGDQDRLHHRAP